MLTLIRRLWKDKSGIALVEFGMSIPVLLTLGLVGMEVAWLMLSHLRVSNIAMITADGASRIRDSIDESDVNEIFIGALQAGDSIDFEQNGRIVLYSVEPHSNGTNQWIRWQRCAGQKAIAPTYGRPLEDDGTPITDGSERTAPSAEDASTMTAIGPSGNQISAQSGTAVIVAEAIYDYQPLVGSNILGATEIRYTSAFNVRQRNDQELKNIGGTAPAACGA
ncbi:MAG: TadE/TadG family type IV pilus assembly protein [Sphingomonadaceae bacterium]